MFKKMIDDAPHIKTIIEPFRIRSVEPTCTTTRRNGYNR